VAERRDDNQMSRFDELGLRRFRARDAVLAVLLAAILLVLFQGPSILKAGKEAKSGAGREVLLAVGRPSSWVAGKLPFVDVANHATGWLNPEEKLSASGAFTRSTGAAAGQIPQVTGAAFTPGQLGQTAPSRGQLHTLLVTGDSMSQPLDSDLAEDLITNGVHVVREPHIGTGISSTLVVDWGALSVQQVKRFHPQAIVVFIGANDGFSMEGPDGREVSCCGAAWAAIYANRVRQIMNTYRQGGAARVFWITLPAPRDPARQRIARVVNAAIEVAAQPWASQIEIVNTPPIFTPGFAYRDAMSIEGKQTIVRQADGIHLNEAGSTLLARYVLEFLKQNFNY
jgi:lysophospholipase L1-like esterase